MLINKLSPAQKKIYTELSTSDKYIYKCIDIKLSSLLNNFKLLIVSKFEEKVSKIKNFLILEVIYIN